MKKQKTGSKPKSCTPKNERSYQILGYARVSTKDQNLDMQESALRDAGCELVFSDHGISGRKAQRPELDRVLTSLQRGDTIVVYKLDRLGRSVMHLADLLCHFENNDIHFRSLTEGINTATSGGKLVFHIMSAFAEFNRDLIHENTMAGLEAAKARGVKLGRPPKLTKKEILSAYDRMIKSDEDIEHIARRLNVSSITLRRGLEKAELFPF